MDEIWSGFIFFEGSSAAWLRLTNYAVCPSKTAGKPIILIKCLLGKQNIKILIIRVGGMVSGSRRHQREGIKLRCANTR
jgi:hypothetical protein